MTSKDYIFIFILIVILVIVVKMMKTSKEQNAVLMAVAVKTGAIDPKMLEKSKVANRNGGGYDDEEEEEDQASSGKPKKVKLKKTQRQTVSLFADGIPKQIGELRDSYMAKFSDIDKVKFYNTLYNLKPSNTLNFEKIDGKNYWGLGEWFDQDGALFEEYAEKIQPSKNSETTTNE